MTVGATPNFINAAAIPDGMLQSRAQGVSHKAKGIEEVTLSRSVRPYQYRKSIQPYLATTDALIVSDFDEFYKGSHR